MNRLLVLLASLMAVGVFALPLNGMAATCTCNKTGNWDNSGGTGVIWAAGCGAGGPVAGDTVVIPNNFTVTIPTGVAAAAGSVQVGNNTNGATALTLNAASSSLTVSGDVSILVAANNNITALNANAGTVYIGGNLTMDNSANTGRTVRLLITTGTVSIGQASAVSPVTAKGFVFPNVSTNVQVTFAGAGALNIGQDFPSGATFTRNSGTVNFNGPAAQSIGTYTYNNLNVTKSAGTATLLGNTTVAGNLTITCPATCTNGTLDTSTFTIDRSAAGGTLQLGTVGQAAPDATLKIGGTNTFPANYSTHTLASNSTVNYNGAAQTVTAETYGNLSLNTSGGAVTKTIGTANGQTINVAGALTIAANVTYSATARNPIVNVTGDTSNSGTMSTGNGAYTLTGSLSNSGTMTTGTGAFKLAGNFTNTGTYTSGTGIFTFNGSSGQSFTGATTFTNLTMGMTGTSPIPLLTANNTITVGTNLTFTNGIISNGGNTVIMNAGATVTGGSSATGWVAGNLQKNVATGANVARTFEVGDTTTYTPISTTFASVGTAGNLVAVTASGDHPNTSTAGAPSGLDVNNSINRYWTMTNSGIVFTTYSATFNYVAGDSDASVIAANLVVAKGDTCSGSGGTRTCTTWTFPTATTPGPSSTQASATSMANFSDFAVGQKKVNNFLVSVPVSPVDTCTAQTVTITARNASNATITNYRGTISLSTSTNHGDWANSTGTGAFAAGTADSGSATYTYGSGDNGVVTLTLRNSHADALTITANDAGAGVSGNTSLTFSGNAFVITNDTIQVANRAQSMSVKMIIGASCGTTNTKYTGSRNLKAWLTRDPSDTGGTAPTIGAVSLPNSQPGATNVTLDFSSGGAGVANFSLSSTDVGKYQLNLLDDNGNFATANITGTSTSITTRPFAVVVSAIKQSATLNPGGTATAGSKFIVAADSFQATVGAYLYNAAADSNNDGLPDAGASLAQITANGGAPSYNASITLAAGAGGFTPATGIGTDGTLSNGTVSSFTSGIATPNTLSYNEVGSFTLTVSSASFLGVNLVSEGRTVVFDNSATPARSGVVGRFYPDHFTVTSFSVTAACAAGGFTYMGQGALGYSVAIEARNKSDAKTTKYDTSGYTTGTVSPQAENNDNGTDLSARVSSPTGSWSTGSFSFTTSAASFSRPASPDGPYDSLQLGVTVSDADGAVLTGRNMNPVTAGACGGACTGVAIGSATKARFGRLRLLPSTGPANLRLPIQIRTEYWNGTGFVTNSLDSCTTLHQDNIAMTAYTKNLNACKTRIDKGDGSAPPPDPGQLLSFTKGLGSVFLTAPGSANGGSVVLTVRLAGPSPGNYCLNVTPTDTSVGTSSAGMGYLQGAWIHPQYNDNPQARAAFGVYGAQPNEFIYQREVY